MAANPRGHYRCGNILYYTAGSLYIAESGAPAGSPPYYTAGAGSGYLYWVFEFKVFGSASFSFNRIAAPPTYSESHTAGSSAGTNGIDLVTTPDFGGHVVGGIEFDAIHEGIATVQYAKAIDCGIDFEGSPITLLFNAEVDPSNPLSYVMDSYPSSVTIEL